jgi:hypothetical protein
MIPEKFKAIEWTVHVHVLMYAWCFPLKEPFIDQLKPLLVGHRIGLSSGDIEFATSAVVLYSALSQHSLVPLSTYLEDY